MPFSESKFEGEQYRKLEREEEGKEKEKEVEKLRVFIKELSEKLKKEGVPLDEDCRINSDAFNDVYPETVIKKDKELVRDYELEWYKGFSQEEIKKEKLKRGGEKLEMLKTAVFAKGLGENFIVARTSLYDDIKNKVDNIILEKETGNIVCALDEVGDTMDTRYKEKAEKVLARNLKEGGGRLKYGLKIEKDKEGNFHLIKQKLENIPLFYLVLPHRHIEEGIKQFNPSFEEKSDHEKKLFDYFLSAFPLQINYLKLEKNLNPELKKRIEYFEKVLQKFK